MKHNIDLLLAKYWEGETSVEDENQLKVYFQGCDIASEHIPYQELFQWMSYSANQSCNAITDMDILLEKYWEGETTIKEEAVLKAYFKSEQIADQHQEFAPLFAFFDNQAQITYSENSVKDIKTKPTTGTKVIQLKVKKWIYAAAAASVLVIGAMFVVNNLNPEPATTKYANIQEIEDPEEALRVTKEALALVSKKFRKSQQSVKENMGALEKASIFK